MATKRKKSKTSFVMVEYDPDYSGGNYGAVGKFVVLAVSRQTAASVGAAFKKKIGLEPACIVHWTECEAPRTARSTSRINVPRTQWWEDGARFSLEDGPDLIVYRSTVDGRLVVEIETDSTAAMPQHDERGCPKMRVWLNEANLDTDSDIGTGGYGNG